MAAGIDMALHLADRLAGSEAARTIQLGIEYDPQPPHGPIDWDTVDGAAWEPWAREMLHTALADQPRFLACLTAPAPAS